jgi:hypothetical protein
MSYVVDGLSESKDIAAVVGLEDRPGEQPLIVKSSGTTSSGLPDWPLSPLYLCPQARMNE